MDLDSVVFYTNSLPDSIDFYREVLDLELEYQDNEYASFTFLNKVSLGIKKSTEKREIPGSQTIIIGVQDIQSLFSSFKQKKCQFYQEIVSHEWGKDFALLDPDGNKIEFLERK